jgi:heme/copper-type cytochrome/quinol oxidase subunit 2
MRRQYLRAFALAALGPLLSAGCSNGAGEASTMAIDPKDPVVHISAQQFSFTPNTITLKLNEPVTLELVSEDVHHGFRLTDFGLLVDVLPVDPMDPASKPTQVRLVPDKQGTFTFSCSYFCGGGHENMTGTLIVE